MSSADRTGFFCFSASFLRTRVRRYGMAVIAVSAAFALQRGLEAAIGFPHSFLLFYPAILIVALLAGVWPGVLGTVSAGLAAGYFYRGSPILSAVSDETQPVGLALFGMIGVAISWLASSFREHANRLQEFEKVVEGLPQMVVVVDRNYRYLIANRAFLQYRGLKWEDAIGRHLAEIMGLEVFRDGVKEHLDECFSVRELENMVERMFIMSKGSVLAAPPSELCDEEYAPENKLSQMEREHIIRVLRETNGVLSGDDGAATRLGLKRTTLQSKMKRLGIHPHEYRNGGATGTFPR